MILCMRPRVGHATADGQPLHLRSDVESIRTIDVAESEQAGHDVGQNTIRRLCLRTERLAKPNLAGNVGGQTPAQRRHVDRFGAGRVKLAHEDVNLVVDCRLKGS